MLRKKLLIASWALIMVFALSAPSMGEGVSSRIDEGGDKMKILIVYYSWSGKTRKMAETIHALVGGDIVEIEPEKPYPSSYRQTVDQVRREMIAGYKPPIKTRVANFAEYDLIFL
ncbi:MAG: hypothetical protein H5T91_00225 [Synergistetes bacterium]|nr:hypothetical protein [Synergistota bacterium]